MTLNKTVWTTVLCALLLAIAGQASARFLSADPAPADQNTGQNFNRYWYANNNPYTFTDPDGRAARYGLLFVRGFAEEAAVQYLATGTVDPGQAATDALTGMVNPMRTVERVADVAKMIGKVPGSPRIADDALVVRGGTPVGANSADGIAGGTATRTDNGITGFSAESANGASLCDLCKNIPNNQVGVTTAGQIRAAGGEVTSTAGRSPNHATVSGLKPEEASSLFSPAQPNPVPKPERTQWD